MAWEKDKQNSENLLTAKNLKHKFCLFVFIFIFGTKVRENSEVEQIQILSCTKSV